MSSNAQQVSGILLFVVVGTVGEWGMSPISEHGP